MTEHLGEVKRNSYLFERLDISQYEDFSGLYKTYHKLVKMRLKEKKDVRSGNFKIKCGSIDLKRTA